MATLRVVDYWHKPAPAAFVDYVLTAAHLTGDYLKIARNYRAPATGDTHFYADAADMDIRNFNAKSATMHRAVVDVLINLAIDGWRARMKEGKQNAEI